MISAYKISDEASKFIKSESLNCFPKETGGILVGAIENNCVIIQHAVGPGPTATHKHARFKRDGNYSQETLDRFVQKSQGKYDYIGEWHSHPVHSPPSRVDIDSMIWIASNKVYDIDEPILLICVGPSRWIFQCFSLTEKKLKLLKRRR